MKKTSSQTTGKGYRLYLAKEGGNKKGVQQIMGGHVLESWKEEMIRIGRAEGHAEGHAEGQKNLLSQQIAKKIAKGKSVEQIAEELEEDLSVIQPIYEELVNKA